MGYYDEALCHSKGEWKKHKYIRKEGKKYYYDRTVHDEESNTTWDYYVDPDTGEQVQVNRDYHPDRYSIDDFMSDMKEMYGKRTLLSKEEIEDARNNVDPEPKEEEEKKYYAKHSEEDDDHLEHHGILGQKWGVRRFQNADGSLTAEGKKRIYNGGAEYGGFESLRSRHRRSIEGAKYENDLKKNQKKLDKALDKGDQKKVEKYTKVDEILSKNKDIMLKDLSDAEIQMGRDYITTVKALVIGGALFGPLGAVAAGTGVRNLNKMDATEREVYAQDRARKVNYDASKKVAKEEAERMRNFDQMINDNGGKLDANHFPSHDREGKPTYMLTDKQKQKYAEEYNEMRKNAKARDDAKKKAMEYDASDYDDWSESESDKLWDSYYDNAAKVRDYDRKYGHLGDASDKRLYEMKQIYYPYDNDEWAKTREKLDKQH